MGYRTRLEGTINISHRVHGPRLDYLTAFTQTRHMRLDVRQCERIADPLRRAVNVPAGFWTIPDSWEAPLVLDMNCPGLAPSLNCPWEMSQDGSAIVWDGWEKPKGYVAWLVVLAALPVPKARVTHLAATHDSFTCCPCPARWHLSCVETNDALIGILFTLISYFPFQVMTPALQQSS